MSLLRRTECREKGNDYSGFFRKDYDTEDFKLDEIPDVCDEIVYTCSYYLDIINEYCERSFLKESFFTGKAKAILLWNIPEGKWSDPEGRRIITGRSGIDNETFSLRGIWNIDSYYPESFTIYNFEHKGCPIEIKGTKNNDNDKIRLRFSFFKEKLLTEGEKKEIINLFLNGKLRKGEN